MSNRGPAASKKVLTGLIGAPIAHSASPAMHERAAEALGLRGHYQLIEVAGADATGLSMMLEGVRRLGFAGVNVTFPYKEAVVPLLDELAPAAASMAAVNTVVVKDGRLIGHNTDTTGFARAVKPLLAPAGNAVAVIGTGGVGKAIAFALASLKVADLRIFDSEPARAEKLAVLLATHGGARVARCVEDALDGATGLVNGTPVGMLPNRDTPVAASLLRETLWVADAVYSPLITPLLAAARAKGARIMTGRELAIYQAADAFELFTGLAPSTEVMGEAFDAVMAARSAAYQAA
ncbi:shikimate dehydrogenase [Bradyrhizobium sp. INPA01-394B]|uniref:Shikimate dehydrogenase (NADP(+)) n=1 Tax=Bradyrhizobium campsiandrae TaxID=1729892 RepID=A0ABR7UJE9_9BRAD|nr:shikimate dehydrogenase [Bradyrhizobium campsiandrae]MBC9880559.1 shikimate dehydrogenase [Bradyrhizobium campsiandrae]MBC9983731.1 shikimate dehydrogenase [Bradyrhizobium campsiandrae]